MSLGRDKKDEGVDEFNYKSRFVNYDNMRDVLQKTDPFMFGNTFKNVLVRKDNYLSCYTMRRLIYGYILSNHSSKC